MKRVCGDCQLCCRLVPVKEIKKPANQRCDHQKFGVGCAVYRTREFPMSCRLWSCRWLTDNAAHGLRRPDRSHYVIDMMPDYVTITHPDREDLKLPVLQIWCDPKFPDAHRDPALRDYIDKQQVCALIRYDASKAKMIAPPSVTGAGWHEEETRDKGGPEHSATEIAGVLADYS